MIRVVIGGEQHRQWLVDVAFRNMFYDELNRPEMYCPGQLHSLLDKCLVEGTVFVAEHDNKPIGTLCSIITTNLYNPNITVLAELVWYVLPEYRNSRAGLSLLHSFKEKGREYDEMTMSLLVESSPLTVSAIEKRGFIMKECGFLKVKNGCI